MKFSLKIWLRHLARVSSVKYCEFQMAWTGPKKRPRRYRRHHRTLWTIARFFPDCYIQPVTPFIESGESYCRRKRKIENGREARSFVVASFFFSNECVEPPTPPPPSMRAAKGEDRRKGATCIENVSGTPLPSRICLRILREYLFVN